MIGNQAPFDFDVSVKDIYSCLKTGATLIIIPKSITSNIIQPIKPSSSPATVKIKSFSCSGTYPIPVLYP